VITGPDLANELVLRGLAEWVVIERAQELASLDEHARVRRREHRVLWQLTVHVDTPAGRGSAHLVIDAAAGSASAAVDQAVALARASVGPAWISRPLAAPARVKLEDPALATGDLADAVRELVDKLPRPVGVTARASLLRERVDVVARQGFHTEWTATLARVDALAIAGRRSLAITREARQLGGLALSAALDHAKRDLHLLQQAVAPSAGPCALVLRADAMLHDDGLGVWSAFASQADAVVERQGLTRYRERAPIAPGADQMAEPLTIRSNGALDFGVRSAPLGDQGDAVRVFALVERGTAAGLGLSPREGALRGRDPNGGVRNLEVATGSWPGTLDGVAPRVVEVRRLRSLAIDPYTGEASLEIALGIDHTAGASQPFRGGSIRIDLIASLAKARRSATAITRGAYKGPDAVLVERAELLG
jgi:hypothetical protein